MVQAKIAILILYAVVIFLVILSVVFEESVVNHRSISLDVLRGGLIIIYVLTNFPRRNYTFLLEKKFFRYKRKLR